MLSRRAALKGGTAVACVAAAGVVVAAPVAATPDDGEIYHLIEERGHRFELDRAARHRWRKAVISLLSPDLQWADISKSSEGLEKYFEICGRPEIKALSDERDRRKEAWRGLENRLAETPANTLKGIHAKLQASKRGKGYRFNDDLARSAADDLARLVKEG